MARWNRAGPMNQNSNALRHFGDRERCSFRSRDPAVVLRNGAKSESWEGVRSFSACCSTRYSTTSARCLICSRWRRVRRTVRLPMPQLMAHCVEGNRSALVPSICSRAALLVSEHLQVKFLQHRPPNSAVELRRVPQRWSVSQVLDPSQPSLRYFSVCSCKMGRSSIAAMRRTPRKRSLADAKNNGYPSRGQAPVLRPILREPHLRRSHCTGLPPPPRSRKSRWRGFNSDPWSGPSSFVTRERGLIAPAPAPWRLSR